MSQQGKSLSRRIAVGGSVVLLVVSACRSPDAVGPNERPADAVVQARQSARYLVLLKPAVADVPAAAAALVAQHQGRLSFVYQEAVRGFAAELPAGAATALASDPRVERVEPDE